MENQNHPDRRQDDWYKKALVEILEAHFREYRRARRWRFAFRILSMVSILAFISLGWIYKGFQSWQRSVPHIAIVRIEGQIAPHAEANADRIIQGLREAFTNPNAQSVILFINSPGGSTAQAEAIYENLKALKAAYPKPVVANIEDVGASAAYYIAVASDKIFAYRSSLVGSIGVRIDSFNLTGLMERLGIERKLYTSGKYKGILDMFSKPEPEAEEKILSTLKLIHQQFIQAVQENRGDKLKKDDPLLFSGMFWSGEEALKLGLIDGILGPEITPGVRKVDYTPPAYLNMLGKPIGALLEVLTKW